MEQNLQYNPDPGSENRSQAYETSLVPLLNLCAEPYRYETYSPPPGSPPRQEPLAENLGENPAYPPPSSTAPEVVASEYGFHLPQKHEHSIHHGHRSMSPTLSQKSTTAVSSFGSPRLEASYFPEGKEVFRSHMQRTPPLEPKRTCRFPKFLFFVIPVVLMIFVGIGIGLGVGLGMKHKSSNSNSSALAFTGDPNYFIGGAIDPSYCSKKGAFNGSGIAFAGLAGESFVTVYFQHHTGSLRWMQLNADGKWIGGSQSEIIATDAKNSTPISIVAYNLNATAERHLFYINKQGFVRQKSITNVTGIWADGVVNNLNLQALDADSVGLQVCWYGNYYGDSDFTKFPSLNGQQNNVSYQLDYGMHLWYASDNTTFQQYGFYEGESTWTFRRHGLDSMDTQVLDVIHGSSGPGSVSYAMMVNLQHSVEIWWKDTNSSLPSLSNHPINSWTNASNAAIPNVHPATSLGYTTFFYAQQTNDYVNGYNVSWKAENTTIVPANTFTVGDTSGNIASIGGTHMSVSSVPNESGGESLYIFYQVEGDDITLFTRDMDGGQSTQGQLPIPLD